MKEKHNKSNDLTDPAYVYLLTVFYSEFNDYIKRKIPRVRYTVEVDILADLDKVHFSLN